MVNSIILAGSQPIKTWDDRGNKALYQIHGKAMVEYVIEAVRGVKDVGKIILVGDKLELEGILSEKVDIIIDSKGSVIENIRAGINYLGNREYVLICSSDIPFITSEAIKDFIDKSKETAADFCYPVVERKESEKKFPDMKRTFIKTKDGFFTGGNIFYVNPSILERCFEIADKLIQSRKNPFKMARILSLTLLINLIMGNLTIRKAEKRFSKLLGIEARAIISEYPEVGNDVDKPDDVLAASAYLTKSHST
jgi:GTP:adenosylcobinamide-phosphate guanylyltransferase